MIGVICLVIIVVLAIIMLAKMSKINKHVDDIYNKVFIMQGGIKDNKARLDAHYKDMAHLNSDIEKVSKRVSELRKHEYNDEPAKEVEAELENLIAEGCEEDENATSNALSELDQRRLDYTKYRKQGMDIKSAGKAVGVSHSTAKRYEQWRQSNKK